MAIEENEDNQEEDQDGLMFSSNFQKVSSDDGSDLKKNISFKKMDEEKYTIVNHETKVL